MRLFSHVERPFPTRLHLRLRRTALSRGRPRSSETGTRRAPSSTTSPLLTIADDGTHPCGPLSDLPCAGRARALQRAPENERRRTRAIPTVPLPPPLAP